MVFKDWLIKKKMLKNRSAQDVESRLKRVKSLLGIKTINENSLKKLNNNEVFLSLTTSIRSQLRRSVKLYLEFELEKAGINKEELY